MYLKSDMILKPIPFCSSCFMGNCVSKKGKFIPFVPCMVGCQRYTILD